MHIALGFWQMERPDLKSFYQNTVQTPNSSCSLYPLIIMQPSQRKLVISAWIFLAGLLTALLSILIPQHYSSIVFPFSYLISGFLKLTVLAGATCFSQNTKVRAFLTNCRVSILHLSVHTLLLQFVLSTVEFPYLAPGSTLQASMKCKVFI